MTTKELEVLFAGSDETEAAHEWQDEQAEIEDEDVMPSECARCGWKVGSVRPVVINMDGEERLTGMALIGERWVCHDCEDAELEEYATSEADYVALAMSLDEDRSREEQF